jgi:ABC-type nickel/cobalt efflux system permease component RcnA
MATTEVLRLFLAALVVLALTIVATAPLAAHPISKQHHDRTILVRLTDAGILVEYTLALDQWTLAVDLVPYSKKVDFTGKPRQLYEAFAGIYGPLIAEGLIAGLDGEEVKFTYAGYQLKEEDHLRYTFRFKAPLQVKPERPTHRFQFYDSNFAAEPGQFRLAVRSEGRVAIKESNVVTDPEKARPITMLSFDSALDEKLRTAKVTFSIAAGPALDKPAIDEQPAPAAQAQEAASTEPLPEPPSFWQALQSMSLQKLLNWLLESEAGLTLALFVAFWFGAAHALQPGHGKTLVAAYLIGEQGTVAHAFLLGLVTTLTHTSVVILLAIVVPLLFPDNPSVRSEVHYALSLGCGVIVVLLACWLLLRRLTGQADHVHLFGGHHHHHHGHHHHGHTHHHGDHDHHHHHHGEPGQRVGWWALVSMGITGGLVPCVDALALLTLTWVAGKLWLGLPLILAFSLGLASVLVAMGVLVVKFKRFATSRWGEGQLVRALPVLSALATLALGIWMCHYAVRSRSELERHAAVTEVRTLAPKQSHDCQGRQAFS